MISSILVVLEALQDTKVINDSNFNQKTCKKLKSPLKLLQSQPESTGYRYRVWVSIMKEGFWIVASSMDKFTLIRLNFW